MGVTRFRSKGWNCWLVDGWLVPPEDPVALAQSLLLLLENPTRRGEMGTAAQRKVALQFTLDRMVRETLSFYQRLLGDSSRLPSL